MKQEAYYSISISTHLVDILKPHVLLTKVQHIWCSSTQLHGYSSNYESRAVNVCEINKCDQFRGKMWYSYLCVCVCIMNSIRV